MKEGELVCVHCGELDPGLLGKLCDDHELYYCWDCREHNCPGCEEQDLKSYDESR